MDAEFINITTENLAQEHLCCIIRSKKPHPGIDAKRQWLSDRLKEGHVFRKLNAAKATVFIEYAPLETAWVPIIGDNFYYVYCLWVLGREKGKGYGRALMEYCLDEARKQGKSGVCMLGSKKQKAWLSDQAFAPGWRRSARAALAWRQSALPCSGRWGWAKRCAERHIETTSRGFERSLYGEIP